jgi:hypothetical protein
MMQDLMQRHCGVAYHPHDSAPWLKHRGLSSPKAHLVSEHLNAATRLAWRQSRWPKMLRQAQPRRALLLFGDEASLAQWGSLSSTWAPQGPQPAVPTSGKRQASKVLGLIDSFAGRCFYKAHAGRFNAQSSAAFLLAVRSHTPQPVVVLQDGARDHTSTAMQAFFETHADR